MSDAWVTELIERCEALGIHRSVGDSLYLYSQYDDEVLFKIGSQYRALAISVVTDAVLHIQCWARDGVVDIHVHTGPVKPEFDERGFIGKDELIRDVALDTVVDIVWHRIISAVPSTFIH